MTDNEMKEIKEAVLEHLKHAQMLLESITKHAKEERTMVTSRRFMMLVRFIKEDLNKEKL